MPKKNSTLTQHQKRINIMEILYQYFLEEKTDSQFDKYLTEVTTEENQEQIKTVKEIIWYQESLTQEIEKHLKSGWTFQGLKPIEEAILILATYEIIHTNTQKAIIINEAVILAKEYCDNNTYKYINGVLDKVNK